MTQTALARNNSVNEQVLYMAMELSNSQWKVAFGVGGNPRIRQIAARDLSRLWEEISKAKRRFGLPEDTVVVSCYEAGRDGFWIHRYLLSVGVKNLVVDSASIEVNRRKRRIKTDRVDVKKLYMLLTRHDGGEAGVWCIVRVPSEQVEDERRVTREQDRLQKEIGGHSSRIKSLLILHGIVAKVDGRLPLVLDKVRLFDGSELGSNLKAELMREFERWALAKRQMSEILNAQRAQVRAAKRSKTTLANRPIKSQMVAFLMALRGIGERSAWPLVDEFLWRDFKNRREVGQAAGLCGTPYDSGGSVREQGISKVGSKRIRKLMVELSWCWLRYQPQSAITRWFDKRFGHGGRRMRRIGIVAVARRLLIALWRYVKCGVVPEGALFKGTTMKAA
ncbi:MAG: transposase [Myxococcota bacterium]|nr:transposase [Myxococcota bacterium]